MIKSISAIPKLPRLPYVGVQEPLSCSTSILCASVDLQSFECLMRCQRPGWVKASGAFGEVYMARMNGTTPVIVKTARSKQDKQSIEKEMRLLCSVPRHPHVVAALRMCADAPDGQLRLVLEYCAYGSVTSFLQSVSRVGRTLARCVGVLRCVMVCYVTAGSSGPGCGPAVPSG